MRGCLSACCSHWLYLFQPVRGTADGSLTAASQWTGKAASSWDKATQPGCIAIRQSGSQVAVESSTEDGNIEHRRSGGPDPAFSSQSRGVIVKKRRWRDSSRVLRSHASVAISVRSIPIRMTTEAYRWSAGGQLQRVNI
ncbi:uncharacterized protein BDV17DRAFT_64650 [Aspergillus undulatus]|uniref:uncharacterized protein n=1 Tax=Aspergillus undulatus TaxID=1810928 RepID=UPI003CCDD71E